MATARTVIATRNIDARAFRSVARASLAMSVEQDVEDASPAGMVSW
jgi:hypothetical protein